MDAILAALVALMALAAAMAAVLSTLSKAAIFALLAVAPCLYRYRKRIYVIIKTLPRDLKFLWRYTNGIIRSKRWGRQNATVAELFTQRALRCPDAPCFIVVDDRTWTFKQMAEKSNQVARVMQEHVGLKRGDVVCVFMPNCGEYVWSWLGMAKVGAVSALINSNLRHKPLLHCIQVAKAKAIIFSDSLAGAIDEVRDQLPAELKLFQLYGECGAGVIDFGAEMEKHPPEYPVVVDKPQYKDTLLYIYTSGTTGMPKAAVLPNSKYLLVVVATVHMLGLRSSDRLYNPLPLYHTAGGLVGTGAALVDGIPSVLRAKFSGSNYWTDCIKYQCTVAQYIGEMCRYLLAQPPRPTDSQHRVRIMVGNGMRPAIWQQMVDRFKVPQINEIYGATEGNANIINVDNKVGAVGFLPQLVPTFLHPIALVRTDEQGQLMRGPDGYCVRCQPNEPGMFIGLIAQGNASREYYGYVDKSDSNKKLVRDVFCAGDAAFVSGDILVADELGYLYFRDRTGDTYKWKGENVATAEVEDALIAALARRDCVVYGVSIPQTEGRAGMAAIADPERSLDLGKLARDLDLSLPSYARPLFLRIMNDIEITGTFKLKKLQYQKEGFDPDVIKDPLYFRAGADFVPITSQLFNDICNGRVKL
ncbi:PREDICTED: long-chain fatty acid transport protein 4-like [Papilio xuthus]|uniref:Very long-chain fatty acid transport protein n=1 Tax=Papilio xuthus TaxID=66420 RepID=A0A194PKR7_PAPXU|nr:PREDICTED: long-chain fatty acid transport protein 4-like [Papilio xuthus]KPI93922.1 Long-chain fatty acid transport protein 4 [Papilio xuthus]